MIDKATPDPILQITDLNKYFGSLHVLKSLNATIHRGEVVSVMGPSGSGKSTFIRCLNRIEEPTSGTVMFDGREITDPHANMSEVRRDMGMVFQNFGLFPHLTALENITLAPMKVRKTPRNQAVEAAMVLLRRVGLEEKAHVFPDQLSGGQQQRVAIARSLAMNPKVLFFDEPTSALDPEMVREVLDVMVRLAEDGMTMMVVSHEISFIREASSRVLVLVDGKIIEDGLSKTVISNPEHPRTREFLGKLL
ncbi:amino acid ABC transporter ATP-binding protein [Paracoccaceae bacterium]